MNRPSKRYMETMSALISRKNDKHQNELEETRAKQQSRLDEATANHEEAKFDYEQQIDELKRDLQHFHPLDADVNKSELRRGSRYRYLTYNGNELYYWFP